MKEEKRKEGESERGREGESDWASKGGERREMSEGGREGGREKRK